MPETFHTKGDSPEGNEETVGDSQPHEFLSDMMNQGKSFSGHERNCVFTNLGDGTFANTSAGSGLDFPDDARALVAVDWDRDGDLDLWISNRNAPRLRLLRNDIAHGDSTRALGIRLRGNGTTSNRDAIGARVTLEMEEDPKPLTRGLRAGEGYLSQSSKWLHFGLGKSTMVAKASVRWPDGSREDFSGLKANGRFLLVQGTGTAVAVLDPANGVLSKLESGKPTIGKLSSAARVPAVTLYEAPKLNIENPDGRVTKVGNGSPVLINLWASWCAPCLEELREFSSQSEKLTAAGIGVVALCVDGLGDDESVPGNSSTKAQKFLEQIQFPFASAQASPEFLDAMQKFHDGLVGLHRPLPIPSSFLIDSLGRVSVLYKGPVGVDQVVADVAHSAGTRHERWLRSVPLAGSSIADPQVRLTLDLRDASHHYRQGLEALKRQQPESVDNARYHFETAVKLSPVFPAAHKKLGQIYLQQQQWAEAVAAIAKALEQDPEDPAAHFNLARTYLRLQNPGQAKVHFAESIRQAPAIAQSRFEYAALLASLGQVPEAVTQYRAGLKVDPRNIPALNNLAWILATSSNDGARQGPGALKIAQELAKLQEGTNPNLLDTLAAALAENGNFPEAIATAERAVGFAKRASNKALADTIRRRLQAYRRQQPWRE